MSWDYRANKDGVLEILVCSWETSEYISKKENNKQILKATGFKPFERLIVEFTEGEER